MEISGTRNYGTINGLRDKGLLLNKGIIKVHDLCMEILNNKEDEQEKIKRLIKKILCLDNVNDPDFEDIGKNASSIALFRKSVTRGTVLLLAAAFNYIKHPNGGNINKDEFWDFIQHNCNDGTIDIVSIQDTVNSYLDTVQIDHDNNTIKFDHKWRLSSWFGHSLYKLSMVKNANLVNANISINDHKIAASIGILNHESQFYLLSSFAGVGQQVSNTKLLRYIAVSLDVPINKAELLLTNPEKLIAFINQEIRDDGRNPNKKFSSSIGFKLFHYINCANLNENYRPMAKALLIKLIANGNFKNNAAVLATIYKYATNNDLKREIYLEVIQQIKDDMFITESAIKQIADIIKDESAEFKKMAFLRLLISYSKKGVQQQTNINYLKCLESFFMILLGNNRPISYGVKSICEHLTELVNKNNLDLVHATYIFGGFAKKYIFAKDHQSLDFKIKDPINSNFIACIDLAKPIDETVIGLLKKLIPKFSYDNDIVIVNKVIRSLYGDNVLKISSRSDNLSSLVIILFSDISKTPNPPDNIRKLYENILLDLDKKLKIGENILDSTNKRLELNSHAYEVILQFFINYNRAMRWNIEEIPFELMLRGSATVRNSQDYNPNLLKLIEYNLTKPEYRNTLINITNRIIEDINNNVFPGTHIDKNCLFMLIEKFSDELDREAVNFILCENLLSLNNEVLFKIFDKYLNKESHKVIMQLLMSQELWNGKISFESMQGIIADYIRDYNVNLYELIWGYFNAKKQTILINITNKVIKNNSLLSNVNRDFLMTLIDEFSDNLDQESVASMLCVNVLRINHAELLKVLDKYFNCQDNPRSLIKDIIKSKHIMLNFNELYHDSNFNFELLCQSILDGYVSVNEVHKDYNSSYKLSYELIGSFIYNILDSNETAPQKLKEHDNFCKAMRELHLKSENVVSMVDQIKKMKEDISNHQEIINQLGALKVELISLVA